MGVCGELYQKQYIECFYMIENDKELVQIINNKDDSGYINEEIESKIKLHNNGKREKLIFKKQFVTKGIHSIKFIIKEKLTNMSFMFYNCSTLKEIKFFSFLTDQVTNMQSMFDGCSKLKYLNLTYFNTSNVTDMSYLFYKCNELKEIKGINTFNTAKVEYMDKMFNECCELENLDLSNFDTSNITDMSYLFNKCHKLKKINGINKFNTSNVTTME